MSCWTARHTIRHSSRAGDRPRVVYPVPRFIRINAPSTDSMNSTGRNKATTQSRCPPSSPTTLLPPILLFPSPKSHHIRLYPSPHPSIYIHQPQHQLMIPPAIHSARIRRIQLNHRVLHQHVQLYHRPLSSQHQRRHGPVCAHNHIPNLP